MKFRVERDVLADAAAWVARSLPARPPVPVLGGVLVEASSGPSAGAAHRLRVRLRDLGPRRGRRHHRRSRPRPRLRQAAGRHHPRAALQAGRSRRRRVPRHDQLRQQPVQPAHHAGRGLPAAARDAAAGGHRRRPRSWPPPSRRWRWRRAATTRCRCSPASAWRSTGRGSPSPPPTASASPSASSTWQPEDTEQSTAVLIPARTLAEVAKTLVSAGRVELALSAGDGMLGVTGAGRPGHHAPARRRVPAVPPAHPGRAHHVRDRRGRRC